MWRLFHKLFGWQYVHMENSADEIIRRVKKTPAGGRYVKYYGANYIWLDKPNSHTWVVTNLT